MLVAELLLAAVLPLTSPWVEGQRGCCDGWRGGESAVMGGGVGSDGWRGGETAVMGGGTGRLL